jgi:hypothetical protein
MCILLVYLYYNERKQLKTFVTQFGLVFPSRRTHPSDCMMTKKVE